jgi:hypothetical protein
MFKHFVEGVASGIVSVVTEQLSVSAAADMVKTCCQQLGWSIDERVNANDVCLYFNDPLVRIRKLRVNIGKEGATVGFTVFSEVEIPTQRVPAAALAYLLQRNRDLFVTWEMAIRDNGNVAFALSYVALAAGLRHEVFKVICDTMILEAQEFDARMQKAGLLR